MAHFLVDGCFSCEALSRPVSLNQQRKQKRPAPLLQGRVFSARTSECWNLWRRNKPRTAPRTGSGVTEHRSLVDRSSIRQSPADASLAPSCEDYAYVIPVLRANHPRGLNLTRRTVSAPTTVADLIGDLAALHHRFMRGRVVGSVFCHSE